MPKVVVSGYYGFHNSGDEAMLYAMLTALRDAVPGLEATVLSKDPVYTAREFGVLSIPRDKPLSVLKALGNSDLLISGGGGLLQDINGPKSVIYYLGVVAMAMLLGRPVFLYAQGFGPVSSAIGKALVRQVANRVKLITVRDPDSRDELKALGVTRPQLEVTADPVLGLDTSLVDRKKGRDILDLLGADRRPIAGISVRPWKGLEGYKKVVARAADDLLEQDWQVLLVPMHCPGDAVTCREVAALMNGRALLLEDQTGYADVLSIMANLDLAIGMRLHFLIFGAIFGVPLVGIPYDPKVSRFLQSLGLPAVFNVERLDYNELSAGIKNVLADRAGLSAGLKVKIAALRAGALKNALMAAELLRSG